MWVSKKKKGLVVTMFTFWNDKGPRLKDIQVLESTDY